MNRIFNSDATKGLKEIGSGTIDCCVTSPPYWGLRDYDHQDQIGIEKTPAQYVDKLVETFDEVNRVLKPEGTLWLNLGDSYARGKRGRNDTDFYKRYGSKTTKTLDKAVQRTTPQGLKDKDLVGIPWMVAFALRNSGWYLRQDIIWHKPNPMPESVLDRCTKSHEYIFLMSKSANYYYDQESIKTDLTRESLARMSQDIENQNGSSRVPGKDNGNMKTVGSIQSGKANKKSVWTVATRPYRDAHFATFPQQLIVDCIKAGCPENGIVLDPFMGAGTTALVARKLNRNYIGFEINEQYIEIAELRLQQLGIFK